MIDREEKEERRFGKNHMRESIFSLYDNVLIYLGIRQKTYMALVYIPFVPIILVLLPLLLTVATWQDVLISLLSSFGP